MESSQVQRALDAARSTACELGLPVTDAVVIHNSDRIAVRLLGCDVLARIAPRAWQDGLQFEMEVARRLAETDSPIGALEPRAQPRVYVRDGFALTLWIYYEPVGAITPTDYANALFRLHAGLRRIEETAPHISERIAVWVAEVDNPEQNPELPTPDRELLRTTFARLRNAMHRSDRGEQLLHGEPHPQNLLSTRSGPLFIDFHTCQRGPVEYDIAFVPEDVAAHYPGANQQLVHQFRALMWAGFTTMRWRHSDQLPNRDEWRGEGLNRLRAALIALDG